MPATDIRDITREEGFLGMYDTYYSRVFNFVYFRVVNRAAAEDIVSETFLKAFENRDSYNPDKGALSTWLFTIAGNCAVSYCRRQKRSIPLNTESDEIAEPSYTGPEDELIRREDAEMLARHIKRLEERERTAVYLRYREDMSHNEIAELLDTTPAAVRMLLMRTLRKLKKWVG